MSEPKKALIEAAAKKKWPKLTGITINHRKHTMVVYFGERLLARDSIILSADSHRGLLEQISQ